MLYAALIIGFMSGALIAWEIASAIYEKREAQDANGHVSRDKLGRFTRAE